MLLYKLSLLLYIDLFHNGGLIKYSSVLMLISLSSLATASKFQKNICLKMREVGLINMVYPTCFFDDRFRRRS